MNNVILKLDQSNANLTPTLVIDTPPNSVVEDVPVSNENQVEHLKPSKWKIVKAANHRIVPRASKGEIKLHNLLSELQKFAIVEQESGRETAEIRPPGFRNSIRLFRRRITNFLQQPTFHYIIIGLVMTDLIIVLIDLVLAQLSAPCLTDDEMEEYNTTEQRDACLLEHSVHLERADLFLFYFSVLLLSLFVFEVFLSFYGFGWKYLKKPLYLLDGIIVFGSFFMELYFHYGNIGRAGRAAAAIVILRLWKIVRAIHAVAHSITLKNRLWIKKIQEAQTLLEEEKQTTEQILQKQEIKVEYLMSILSKLGKLPTISYIDTYVDDTWKQSKKPD